MIAAPPVPTGEISGTVTVCQNATTPEIIFVGNEGSAPYTFVYKINDGTNQTISTTTGNQVSVAAPTNNAGTFTYTLISVADSNYPAQNQSGTAIITVNELPTASISGTTNVCKEETSPAITFTGSNGTTPYTFTYKINGGDEQTLTTTTGNSATVNQGTGSIGTFTYTLVSVSDANTCSQNQSGTAIITVNELPTAEISGTTTVNHNTDAPEITFTGLNGTAPYTFTYTINDGANQTITTTIGNTIKVTQPTSSTGIFSYKLVSVADVNNCVQAQSDTATITVNALPTASISGTATVCLNATAPEILFTSGEGIAPFTFTYTINGGANQIVTTAEGNNVAVAQPTTNAGVFTYELVSISDANDVTQAQSGTAIITIQAVPTVTVYPGNTSFCLGQSITPKAEGALSYIWSPTEDLSATTGATVLITPTQTTTYQVTGTGENGCTSTVDFTITIDEDCCSEGNLVQYENTNNLPALTHTSDYIEAGNGVSVEAGQNVVFKSNNFIELKPGFHAKTGGDFLALIEGCTDEATIWEEVVTARNIPAINPIISPVQQEIVVAIYPNPFSTELIVDYTLPTENQVSIQLVDMLGRSQQILLPRQTTIAGAHRITYQNKDLRNGIYFLMIQVGEEVIQRKVIVATPK